MCLTEMPIQKYVFCEPSPIVMSTSRPPLQNCAISSGWRIWGCLALVGAALLLCGPKTKSRGLNVLSRRKTKCSRKTERNCISGVMTDEIGLFGVNKGASQDKSWKSEKI